MKKIKNVITVGTIGLLSLVLSGCNVNATLSQSGNTTTKYQVGGVILGMVSGDTIILQNNSADNVTVAGTVSGNESFAFPTKQGAGDSYYVTIFQQPTGKNCVAGANLGTVSNQDIASVQINCTSTVTYSLGGNITGLTGTGLVLKNTINGLTFDFSNPNSGAIAYTFPTTLPSADTYSVSILSQPTNPSQSCGLIFATGTMGNANVTNINVTCTTNTYSIGGTISGLSATDTITLSDGILPTPGSLPVTGTASGIQTFSFPVKSDLTAYSVSITTQPAGKTCAVTNGAGTLAGTNRNNIVITCSSAGIFLVQGTAATGITGLAKNATIVLSLTASGVNESLSVTNGGASASVNLPYNFLTTFATGASVTVSISQQPASPHQTCTAGGSLGPITVSGANVVLPLITCTTNTYTVAGSISGLSVALDNVGLRLDSSTNGVANAVQTATTGLAAGPSMPFTFPTQIADGSNYTVTVISFSPAGKTCGAPVSGVLSGTANISIVCAAGPTVSVTVSGMSGTGGALGLRLNGDNASNLLPITSGTYTFSAPVLITGDSYSVSIYQQPNRLSGNTIDQQCTLSPNSSGIMPVVGTITVTCSPVAYNISGNIVGLAAGEQAVVYNNTTNIGQVVKAPLTGATGTDPYTLPPMNDGSVFTLTMMSSPNNKVCVFSNGLGLLNATVAGGPSIQNIICGPYPPSGISVIAGNAQTIVNWMTTGGFTYNIYWSTAPGITIGGVGVTKIAGVTPPYTHILLTNGSPYYYRITSVSGIYEGALSQEFSTVPLAPLSVSEGLPGTAMPITIPHNGGIAGGVSSYYQVSALTPNANYVVTLGNMSGNVDLDVFNAAGFGVPVCSSYNSIPTTIIDNCVAAADALGNLWIMVSDPTAAGTFTYTITGTAWPPAFQPINVLPTYNPGAFTSYDVSAGPVWVSFSVTALTQYTVHWDDASDGTGKFSADVVVNGYDSSGNILTITNSSLGAGTFGNNTLLTQIDMGYTTPTVFTAAATGMVYLRVNPYIAPGIVGIEVTSP